MRRRITIIRGQSFTYSGVLRDDSGAPIDLTSLTLTWEAGDKDFLRTRIELTEGNGITIDDAANGKWTVTIGKTDTEDETEGLYTFQGFASDGADINYLFTRGRLVLQGNVRSG